MVASDSLSVASRPTTAGLRTTELLLRDLDLPRRGDVVRSKLTLACEVGLRGAHSLSCGLQRALDLADSYALQLEERRASIHRGT